MAPIRNPFIAGGPVPPEHFINRKREVNAILDRLTGSRPASSAIYGEARIGKTSLLHYLKSDQILKDWGLSLDKFTICFIDCGGIDAPFAVNFWRIVVRELRDEIRNEQVSKDLSEFSISKDQPNIDLRNLFNHLSRSGHRFVLLLTKLRLKPPSRLRQRLFEFAN